MFLIILSIIVCIFLGLIILIQNPKGGGLSSGFAGSNNIMGVQRTGDFLEKGTWGLTIMLMVLALAINMAQPKSTGTSSVNQDLQKQIQKPTNVTPLSAPAPVTPAAGDSAKK